MADPIQIIRIRLRIFLVKVKPQNYALKSSINKKIIEIKQKTENEEIFATIA